MNPINIAYVINTLDVGGAERLVVDLVCRLDRARFRPMVFGAFGGGVVATPIREAGIPMVCFGKHLRFGMLAGSVLSLAVPSPAAPRWIRSGD